MSSTAKSEKYDGSALLCALLTTPVIMYINLFIF